MAVNVDIVYKTVLLILNQQQRGYMTPDEFNKTAIQVQSTIFEGYASDLNQQYRLPDNDTEYGDRVKNIEHLEYFDSKNSGRSGVFPPQSVPHRVPGLCLGTPGVRCAVPSR